MPKALTSFQTNHLVNLDGATYRVPSQRSERIEADSKMFAHVKFLHDNICPNRIIVSPDRDVALIFSPVSRALAWQVFTY